MLFGSSRKTSRSERKLAKGITYLEKSRLDEALVFFRRAASADPDNPKANYYLSTVLLKKEHWEDALVASERASELDDGLPAAHLNSGIALLKLEQWQEAAAALTRALELEADSPDSLRALGIAQLKLEQWQNAASTCRRAIEIEPGCTVSANNLAIALWKDQRLEEAEAAFRVAAELQATAVDIRKNHGAVLMSLERWNEAAVVFQRCVDLDASDEEARSRLDSAISHLERAATPETPAAPQARADGENRELSLQATETVAPEASLDTVSPGLGDTLQRGIEFFQSESWEAAVESLQAAADLAPERSEIQMLLGTALRKCGQGERALAAYRQCTLSDPGNVEAILCLAFVLTDLRRLEEAVKAFGNAISVDSQNALSYMGLGNVFVMLKAWEEALSAFQAGASLEPDNAEFLAKQIEPLRQLGREQEAHKLEHGQSVPVDRPHAEPIPAELPSSDEADSMDLLWTPEKLGPEVFRVERWLKRLMSPSVPPAFNCEWANAAERQQTTASDLQADVSMLFILDNDFGELTTLMYLTMGQELRKQITILLPPRLFLTNGDVLAGQTREYSTFDDILATIEELDPTIVCLGSGYLYALHDILTSDEMEILVEILEEKGIRIVTCDPFLGVLSKYAIDETVSIDLPTEPRQYGLGEEEIQRLREVKHIQDKRLRVSLSRAGQILAKAYHLYPAYTDLASEEVVASDARNLSFFNDELMYSFADSHDDMSAFEGVARPHWLYILSQTDYETQSIFETHGRLLDFVTARLEEAAELGKRPIFIGPPVLTEPLKERLADNDHIDILEFCGFHQLISLLLTAEHAFYWNMVSHSILIRLFNGLPVALFDRGHLVRNVPRMYQRVVDWYYQGREPGFIDYRSPISQHDLDTLSQDSQAGSVEVLQCYQRAPSPAAMINSLIEGSATSQ